MIPHIDNDIIIKLSQLNLVAQGLHVVGASSFRDARILATAPFSLSVRSNRQKGQAKYGKEAHERIVDFVTQTEVIKETRGDSYHLCMSNILGIDAGELILIAEAAYAPNALLITGDKKSLRALAGNSSCAHVANELSGRVLCFEQVMLRIIDQYGYGATKPSIEAAKACNGGLHAAYASGTEEGTVACLSDYVARLRSATGNLLRL